MVIKLVLGKPHRWDEIDLMNTSIYAVKLSTMC